MVFPLRPRSTICHHDFMVSMFHFSKKCGFFSRFHEFPMFLQWFGNHMFLFRNPGLQANVVMHRWVSHRGRGRRAARPGLHLHVHGEDPRDAGAPVWDDSEAEAHGNGFTVAKIYGVCQPTIKIWLSQLYSSDISWYNCYIIWYVYICIYIYVIIYILYIYYI